MKILICTVPLLVLFAPSASSADSPPKAKRSAPASNPADPFYIFVNLGDLAGLEGGSTSAESMAKQRLADEAKAHRKTSLFQVEWSAEVLGTHSNTKYWYDRRSQRLTIIEQWSSMESPLQTMRKSYRHVGDRFVWEIRY